MANGFSPVLFYGACLNLGALFKETGTSALGALGLFILAQPFLKNRSWKQTFGDMALLALGAVLAIAPLYIWIIGWDVHMAIPYSSIWKIAAGLILPAKTSGAVKGGGSYITAAWKIMPSRNCGQEPAILPRAYTARHSCSRRNYSQINSTD